MFELPYSLAEEFHALQEGHAIVCYERSFAVGEEAKQLDEQGVLITKRLMRCRAPNVGAVLWKLQQVLDCMDLEENINFFQHEMTRSCVEDLRFLVARGDTSLATDATTKERSAA